MSEPRQQRMKVLKKKIIGCGKCDGMNIHGVTQAAPGYGSEQSPVVIVGQSLCRKCMDKQEPFVGGSGSLINRSLKNAGIAKLDIFITNVVHCHPPKNHKSLPEWITNCTPYLHRELDIVQPRLVIGLGKDAEAALRSKYPGVEPLEWPFTGPRATTGKSALCPALLFAKHPAWIARQHKDSLEQEYVTSLACALKWGFRNRRRPGG
ncbi:uracil-DNA glycosylase [Mycobacterium sp. E2327]|uniref:uracil-DNA glycosylase family protein n=1 Tax=Mycobacterium sp. E2327 TaxID=1834132 RepID=UPI0007FFEC30|nr:uracil-DNA glycosylase family protein [Mycobacterium sp. E2327]OBI14924.1 uracil-DNA glycosylase [Mycobacterium sp. E2327]